MEPIVLDNLLSRDNKGRAVVPGTPFKVQDVVLAHLAWGWSPAEIHEQYERRLSMAQIHAALTYYFANQAEIDRQLVEEDAWIDSLRQSHPSPFADRMRAEGRIQ
ncbi:MAG: DUF433 domain-containing protein [Planctomycetota bacterium]